MEWNVIEAKFSLRPLRGQCQPDPKVHNNINAVIHYVMLHLANES